MNNVGPSIGGNYQRIVAHSEADSWRPALRVGRHRMRMLSGNPTGQVSLKNPCVAEHLWLPATEDEMLAAERVAMSRPAPLRDYDQISMQAGDLLKQVKLMQPLLEGKRVVYMGDNDGASLLAGLLGIQSGAMPEHMTLLDFDRRILAAATALAKEAGFADRFEARPYNAFNPVPADLAGRFDVFYTNPPYGKANMGASGRLFITRGLELCHHQDGACGCVILPDDDERPWTARSMWATQKFLIEQGWIVREKFSQLHHYHLAGDPGLTSSTLWITAVRTGNGIPGMPYVGEHVRGEEIEYFYGRKVKPPYPRYIREDGEPDYDWASEETKHD